jgi:hypothetical protein
LRIPDLSKSDYNSGTKGYNIPSRATNNCCFGLSYQIVAHPIFSLIIVVLIMANIVLLAMDQVGLTERQLYLM